MHQSHTENTKIYLKKSNGAVDWTIIFLKTTYRNNELVKVQSVALLLEEFGYSQIAVPLSCHCHLLSHKF